MSVSPSRPSGLPVALALIAAGLVLAFAAWSLPVNLKSISPALLSAAGAGTPSLAQFGQDLIDSEKIGPAALVLEATKAVHDPRADVLDTKLGTLTLRQADLVPWGGWDPLLEPVFTLHEAGPVVRRPSTPALTYFLPERIREKLRNYLSASRSAGVRSLLQLRELTSTGRFVPATQPGGQPLDALLLMTALLYQGEHLAPPLQRELRSLADTAIETRTLGELEPALLDLLSLTERLNWVQLGELLRCTESTRTLGEYAHLARVAPDQLALTYTAALFSGSADRVASYLIQYGKPGVEDLSFALARGQGAVRQLLLRQVPVNRATAPALSAAAELGLIHPRLALVIKYLGFFLGAFLVFRGCDRGLFTREAEATLFLPRARSGVLALFFAALIVVATEPFLLRAAPPSEFKVRLVMPVLGAAAPTNATATSTTATMDTSTLLSIGLFASLQVAMYFICLLKIREVARQAAPPLVKLKLMENEENLFDGGLYLGIGGTATALVLQVLGIIEPNLLAAYSSNLFGITCVALVKIRHVRPYKRELILESQVESKIGS